MLNIRLRWPRSGVRLTVGFLDNPEPALREKILFPMNLWNKTANVAFTETLAVADADVRINRLAGAGHWSWLGIDIRNHPGEPTMNLDGFTLATSDAEFVRVVCHETGHTLGFPHEHLRADMIERLDREATIRAFMASQGWTREDVIFQLAELTPDRCLDQLSWSAIWRELVARVKTRSPDQTPWLSSHLGRRVFCGPPTDGDLGYAVQRVGAAYRLNAGALSGVTPGAVVAVYPPLATRRYFPSLGDPDDRAHVARRRGATLAACAVLPSRPARCYPGSVRDPTAAPWLLEVAVFAIPLAVLALVGMMAFRRVTPLAYRCRRCERDFQRAAHRAFPTACPNCHARDWSL